MTYYLVHFPQSILDVANEFLMSFTLEIKDGIEDVAQRGCHRSTLKIFWRFATVICCGGVIVGTPWGVALRHDTMNIGNGPLENFWEGGKVQKNFRAREN